MLLLTSLVSLSITGKHFFEKVPAVNLCELMETCSAATPPCGTLEDRVGVCGNEYPSEYTKGGKHTKKENNYAKCVVMAEYYKFGETNCAKLGDDFKKNFWEKYKKETKANPAMKKSLTGDDTCGDKIKEGNPPWGKPNDRDRLKDLMMMGAHDACVSNGKPEYRTQSKSLRCQAISSPTRVFDTRFKKRPDGTIWSLHPSGAGDHFAFPLEKHLRDTYKFLNDNPTEFLIFRVKMLKSFLGSSAEKDFAKAVKTFDDKNGGRLLAQCTHAELLQKTTNELKGKLIILLYKKDKPGKKAKSKNEDGLPHFWNSRRILTGRYSNQNTRDGMIPLQHPSNPVHSGKGNGWQVGQQGEGDDYDVDGHRLLHGVWYTLTFTMKMNDETSIRRNYDNEINTEQGQEALYKDLTTNHNEAFTKPAVIWFDFNGDLAEDAAVYKFMRDNKGKCTSTSEENTKQGKDEL